MSNTLRPGNSFGKALRVGFGFETTLNDRIGAKNQNDFFRFRVNRSSYFRARLINGQPNVGFQLLGSSGQVLQASTRSGSRSQSVRSELNPGDYYIRVFSTNPRNKPYQLRLFKDEILCGCNDNPADLQSTVKPTARSLFT